MGGVGGWGGFTVIIMQVSIQIGLNWIWPTGTELGEITRSSKLLFVLPNPYNFSPC